MFALLPSTAGFGKPNLGVDERSQEAVALVEIVHEGRVGYRAAFCVDPSGLFVTSAGVVSLGLKAGAVNLVLSPGAKGQQRVTAKVVRWNEALGLSVLRIDPVRPLTVLELGSDDSIRETLPVKAYGFPPADGVPEGAPTPAVTGQAVRVTALRRVGGKLAQVQIDGQFHAGYSGSPLVDPAGKVIGIVESGLLKAGINFAIPVGRLADYLTTPLVLFEPPPVDLEDRPRSIDWTLKVLPAVPGTKLPADLAVSLTLPGSPERPRRVSARAAGAGIYTARVVPLLDAPERLITLAVESSTGKWIGVTPDLLIRIGGQAITLGDLRSIRMSRPPRAVLRDDTTLRGEILGLGRVELLTEAGPTTIDLRRARLLEVLKVGEFAEIGSLQVGIQVRRGAASLCQEIRRVDIHVAPGELLARRGAGLAGGMPRALPATADSAIGDAGAEISGTLGVPKGLGSPGAIHPPTVAIPEAVLAPGMARELPAEPRPSSASLESLAQTARIVRLPGKITDITSAGGGRYLLLTLGDSFRLAIFDVNAADVVKTLALPYEKFLVAGGGEKFVLVFPDRSVIERWDLATLTREDSKAVPIRPKIWIIGMGSDSSGPLLAGLDINLEGLPMDTRGRWCFIDPVSLKVLKVRKVVNSSPLGDQDRLSPGGGVLSLVGNFWLPVGRYAIRSSDDGGLFLIYDRVADGLATRSIEIAAGVVKTRHFPVLPHF
jgi:hypothetical protein